MRWSLLLMMMVGCYQHTCAYWTVVVADNGWLLSTNMRVVDGRRSWHQIRFLFVLFVFGARFCFAGWGRRWGGTVFFPAVPHAALAGVHAAAVAIGRRWCDERSRSGPGWAHAPRPGFAATVHQGPRGCFERGAFLTSVCLDLIWFYMVRFWWFKVDSFWLCSFGFFSGLFGHLIGWFVRPSWSLWSVCKWMFKNETTIARSLQENPP